MTEGELIMAQALAMISAQQSKTLATLQRHGVVFDGPLGADPKNWQHVAFSIYTDLCSCDSLARAALDLVESLEDGPNVP